ncbi:Metallo-dependent phosphatase [Sistotremastrum niveocremeum HHB9708]|uniref:Metallo-dependent phosphatase n=1 Tax=Sistotremastrum niveocremeum HHB9708 TaxID=1314777 RepID=A0A164TNZ7_9AGAM|nr:Metallo-dependent phosphatase [Sistotremastrum niveocremeum HHB9708]
MSSPDVVRRISSVAIVATFLVLITFLGLLASLRADSSHSSSASDDSYVHLMTLSEDDLALNKPNRRVIILGDVHGMVDSLAEILDATGYNEKNDYLIHVGDIVAKSGVPAALQSLDYFSSLNITGVRGNHDDKVIQWRYWIDEVLASKGGKKWLRQMEKSTPKQIKKYMKSGANLKAKWVIPEGWKFAEEHYWIAKEMSQAHFDYFSRLPLALHIPSLHTFIAHAGLLPTDTSRSHGSPLSRRPSKKRSEEKLRLEQEQALLHKISQNRDPWTVMNMRSILEGGDVTRKGDVGQPWSEIWNEWMDKCGGFDVSDLNDLTDISELGKETKLPCRPSTVIYGHAASRGLDVKRWTMGLDSGCVYGRRLTAMIITSDSKIHNRRPFAEDSEVEELSISHGETGRARLVSISCPEPPPES